MKKLIALVCSLMAIQFFACVQASDTLRPGETIKIGFIAPMTGDYSGYGILPSQAVGLAVDEFNEQGGINGFKVQLFVEDSAGNAEKGVKAANKLIKIDNVLGIVGDIFSSPSLAIASIAEAEKVVMISPGATHKDFTNIGKYIFRLIINDSMQTVVFARYLVTVEKAKTVAILYMNNSYSSGIAMGFREEYEKNGGHIVAVETAEPGTKNFRDKLRKIKEKQPEILYLPNYVSDTALIVKQAKEIKLDAKICSSDAFANLQIFDLLGGLSNGIVFSQKGQQENKLMKDFVSKVESKLGRTPDYFSFNSYDAAYVMLNAIKQASSKSRESGSLNIDRDKIRGFISITKDYGGVSGSITFTATGDLVGNIGIYVAENRSFKLLKNYRLDGQNLIEFE